MSTKPGSNVQDNKKDSTKVDTVPRGGDEAGDAVGEREVGDVVGGTNSNESYVKEYLECKICGSFSKTIHTHKKHISKSHSKFAISIAKDFTHKSTQEPEKLNRYESCGRTFFFQETWNRHRLEEVEKIKSISKMMSWTQILTIKSVMIIFLKIPILKKKSNTQVSQKNNGALRMRKTLTQLV